jgi:hypothetical protein
MASGEGGGIDKGRRNFLKKAGLMGAGALIGSTAGAVDKAANGQTPDQGFYAPQQPDTASYETEVYAEQGGGYSSYESFVPEEEMEKVSDLVKMQKGLQDFFSQNNTEFQFDAQTGALHVVDSRNGRVVVERPAFDLEKTERVNLFKAADDSALILSYVEKDGSWGTIHVGRKLGSGELFSSEEYSSPQKGELKQ